MRSRLDPRSAGRSCDNRRRRPDIRQARRHVGPTQLYVDRRRTGVGESGFGRQIVRGDHAAIRGDPPHREIADGNAGEDAIERTEAAVLDEVQTLLARGASLRERTRPAPVARPDQPNAGRSGAEGTRERLGDGGEDALALEGVGHALRHLDGGAERPHRRL